MLAGGIGNSQTDGQGRRPGATVLWRACAAGLVLLVSAAAGFSGPAMAGEEEEWTPAEKEILRSLWIGSLPKLPPDPTNKVADDPRAANFGHALFFETRLSSNGKVACATCHDPAKAFTDGRPLARGVGVTNRNAPTIIGAAYNPWFFWDGRKDSMWSQALASLENPKEHNMPRGKVVAVIARVPEYRRQYEALFGPLPKNGDKAGIDRAFANVGKAIAAYERRILPGAGKFDRYVEAVLAGREPKPADRLTLDESQGLHVFISDPRGQCLRCHNGPLFTNHSFQNIGVPSPDPVAKALGRESGIRLALKDPFRCNGRFSDARPASCLELRFARTNGKELRAAFKVPTLRNIAQTAPYMHTGKIRSLEDVMWHYRTTPASALGKSALRSATITGDEFEQLEAFIRTLNGPVNAPAKFLKPPKGGS